MPSRPPSRPKPDSPHPPNPHPPSNTLVQLTRTLLLHARARSRAQRVGDSLVSQEPRSGAAHLPLVEPDRVPHALDHAVQIGVVEHDDRALAAELERELLTGARRRLADQASY